jgi:hypothetical protein
MQGIGAFSDMIYARGVAITHKSEKLVQRVSGLSLMQSYLTESLDRVVNSYAGVKFRNSNIDKANFYAILPAINLICFAPS